MKKVWSQSVMSSAGRHYVCQTIRVYKTKVSPAMFCNIGLQAPSFKRPLLSVDVDEFVCLYVQNLEVKS